MADETLGINLTPPQVEALIWYVKQGVDLPLTISLDSSVTLASTDTARLQFRLGLNMPVLATLTSGAGLSIDTVNNAVVLALDGAVSAAWDIDVDNLYPLGLYKFLEGYVGLKDADGNLFIPADAPPKFVGFATFGTLILTRQGGTDFFEIDLGIAWESSYTRTA